MPHTWLRKVPGKAGTPAAAASRASSPQLPARGSCASNGPLPKRSWRAERLAMSGVASDAEGVLKSEVPPVVMGGWGKVGVWWVGWGEAEGRN